MVEPTAKRQPTKEARLIAFAQAVGRLTGRVDALENAPGGGGGAAVWGGITGSLANQTDLQAALNGKQAAGSYAPLVHTHVIGDVTGLQPALDAKQAAGSYALTGHSHIISDVTGLQAALDAKVDDSQITAFSLTLLDDANAAAWRSTLGLGTAAVAATGDFAAASHVGSGGTAHSNVIASGAAGFMTGADKAKLDAITGTNTGDQTSVTGNAGTATSLQTGRTIAMTGDVVWTSPTFNGTANVTATGVIANDAVTYAKMQNTAAASILLGRGVGAAGDLQEITLGTNLSMTGTTLNAAGGGGGGVTDGDKGDITVSASGATWTIDDQAVTFAKIQNIATARLAGRTTAAAGPIEELTAAQAKTLLGIVAADVSDFNASARAQTEAELVAGSNITITPSGSGATRQLTLSAAGGGGGAYGPHAQYPIAVGEFAHLMVNATALTTIAAVANRFDFMPFIPARTITVDQLSVEVTTLIAASQARLGIYSPDASNFPGNLLVQSATVLDCSTVGDKVASITATVLTAGVTYWIAILSNSTQTYRGCAVGSLMGLAGDATASAIYSLRRGTASFAAMPATAPATTRTSSTAPHIRLRRSA